MGIWKRKHKDHDCRCGREHVRTKSGVLLSIDPGSESGAALKRALEDNNTMDEQVKAAMRRYMIEDAWDA